MLLSIPACVLLFVPQAAGQNIRPSDERIELPEPGVREASPDLQIEGDRKPAVPETPPPLPPLEELLKEPAAERPGGREPGAVRVEAVRFVGNTAITDEVLARVAAPWLGRSLDRADLSALRDALTLAYVERGYVTSGATIPEQPLSTVGLLEIEIVEGRLARIVIENEGRLRDAYLRSRIERGASRPLHVEEIEQALARLQRNRRIKRVAATLEPGASLGESDLRVAVEEADPWQLQLIANNEGAPSVGEWRGIARAGHANVAGFGDGLEAELEGGEGLQELSTSYAVPITRFDTILSISMRQIWSEIVESPLSRYDISSRLQTYRVALSQPLYETERTTVMGFMQLEWRRAKTYLDGDPFSFVEGPENGRVTVVPLRMGLDWTWQTPRQALALRNQLTFGLDTMRATRQSGDLPDGQFVSWLAQLQYARRLDVGLGRYDPLSIVRAEAQIASRGLLGIEQYALGGLRSVRGVRANTIVRDNGVLGSIELRQPLPLPRIADWRPSLDLVVFADAGRGWNDETRGRNTEMLVSLGIGARLSPAPGWLAEIYWAEAVDDVDTIANGSLQDDGVYLEISWTY